MNRSSEKGAGQVSTIVSLLVVVLLVLLNGFFVAAEFALVSVRKSRVDAMVRRGSAAAKMVQRAIGHLDLYIAATQLGITMASLGLGFVAEPSIAKIIDPLLQLLPFLSGPDTFVNSHTVALVIAFAVATTLHIVFGELAPKSIALQRPDVTALWVTAPLNLFLNIFRPFIIGLNGIGNAVVRLIGLQPAGEHGSIHSVEELELLVHSTRVAGLLEEQQERMVSSVFEFSARSVSRVMTPRTEVSAAPIDVGLDEVARLVDEASHSRLPIYEGNLDRIVGVIHAKDVLHHLRLPATAQAEFTLRSSLRPVPFVPESLPLDEVMAVLRRQQTHMAVVIDEYGGTAGIVTFEDLLEEIVGEVADEFNRAPVPVDTQADGTIVLDGRLALDEVDERFALGLGEVDYDTLGGYVFGRLGRVPRVGDRVALPGEGYFEVAELDGLRIARVLLLAQDAAPRGDEEGR